MPRTAKPTNKKMPEDAVIASPGLDDEVELGGVHHEHLHNDVAGVDHDEHPIHKMLREQDGYQHPSTLDAPPPRAGYVQRWVRASDVTGDNNWSMQVRDGWVARNPSTVPHHATVYLPSKMSTGEDVIRVGSMILCEKPIDLHERREAVMARMTDDQQRASIQAAADAANDARKQGIGGRLQADVDDIQVVRGSGRPPTSLE
jgi:hypothetical protein